MLNNVLLCHLKQIVLVVYKIENDIHSYAEGARENF